MVINERLKINPRVGWRSIGNEIVAFNCANQRIVIWNVTASELWKKLAGGCSREELIKWLAQEYSLDSGCAVNDVNVFLDEAREIGFFVDSAGNDDHGVVTHDGENVLLVVEMKAIECQTPFAVTFEVTYACNENCLHCYMQKGWPALSFEEIRRILDEIAAAGCLFVSFTGGEFFARPDALEIINHASSQHFVIDILSNGTLITREISELLATYPVRRVQISLYGATAKTHDAVTRLTGSFQHTIEAIQYLRTTGVKVEVACPLMGINFSERNQLKTLVESLGGILSPNPIITARNDGSSDTFSMRLSNEQLRLFFEDKELSSLYAGRKPFQDHQFYFGFSDILEAAPCYSGFNSCAITPAGKVLPCNQLLLEVGDLRTTTFHEVWHNSPKLLYLRHLKLRDLSQCANCRLLLSCARCPGLAFLEGGDLLGPSPENCRMALMNSKLSRER